jgi:hypothetical protein
MANNSDQRVRFGEKIEHLKTFNASENYAAISAARQESRN